MISEIAVRKWMRSSMGDKPKDTIPLSKKECKSLIYLIHEPIFTEMLQESAYQNSFILCHYQALLPSYLNLLMVCRLQPP